MRVPAAVGVLGEPVVEVVRYHVYGLAPDHPDRAHAAVAVSRTPGGRWRVGAVGEWVDQSGAPSPSPVEMDHDTALGAVRAAARDRASVLAALRAGRGR